MRETPVNMPPRIDGRVNASVGDGLTISPCRTCRHYRSLPADSCILRPECPLNQPREPIYSIVCNKGNGGRRINHVARSICPFEGCRNIMVAGSTACSQCQSKLGYRKSIGVPPAIIFDKKLPADWRARYGLHAWPRLRRENKTAGRDSR